MLRFHALQTCIAIACLALAACTAPTPSATASAAPALASIDRDAELLARGDYLVRIAGCNDCHSPHDSIVSKYVNKADNGFWHALKFTTRDYPENIKIRDMNRQITQDACIYCHGSLVEDISGTRSFASTVDGHSTRIDCLQCHSEVGHMR